MSIIANIKWSADGMWVSPSLNEDSTLPQQMPVDTGNAMGYTAPAYKVAIRMKMFFKKQALLTSAFQENLKEKSHLKAANPLMRKVC